MKNLFYANLTLMAILVILSGCDSGGGSSNGGSEAVTPASAVTLEAFSDFECTKAWTNRDGALGLKAKSGSGTCKASFPGETGRYSIVLTIQSEFDGQSAYSVAVAGRLIDSGNFPLSSSGVCGCEEEDWRDICPDKNETINLGQHTVTTGDEIKFYGAEDWNCSDHGAYCKWHKITFEPAQ